MVSLTERVVADAIPAPAMNGGPHLEAKGLNAWYAERQAIENVSLDIAAHHITAIIGPSGCGKSTLVDRKSVV